MILLGANIFRSGEEAASAIRYVVQVYEPDVKAVEIYNMLYERIYLPARRLMV